MGIVFWRPICNIQTTFSFKPLEEKKIADQCLSYALKYKFCATQKQKKSREKNHRFKMSHVKYSFWHMSEQRSMLYTMGPNYATFFIRCFLNSWVFSMLSAKILINSCVAVLVTPYEVCFWLNRHTLMVGKTCRINVTRTLSIITGRLQAWLLVKTLHFSYTGTLLKFYRQVL